MTIRRLAQALGLCGVAALGIYSMIASGPNNQGGAAPAAPTVLSLEIPSNAFGAGFSGVTPAIVATATTPASYFVLPLLPTTAPIVRVNLRSPYPSDLSVTATDVTRSVTATIPFKSSGSQAPSTEYFEVVSVTPNNPANWLIYVRYPSSFQGSKSIRTMISDTVGGVASAPLTFVMGFRGSTVTVSIVTQNNDGRITSNPAGIDCPGTCSADFLTTTNVILGQSVTSNSTEFIGWTGNCSGTGNCSVSLLAPGPAIIPTNATVTANFRIHSNTSIPATMLCPAAPLLPGKTWVGQPSCGSPPPLGATLLCDAGGYFCCGVSGGTPTAHCPGGNETGVSCGGDSLGVFGSNAQLIQPGGCYINNP
jgi:hypothetical protein